jgi:TonB family protein
MSVPVDVTVLRSGVPVGIPGRAVDVGEGGLGAVLAAELLPGQVVGVKFQLPQLGMFINAQARVRHENRLRCGLQFVGLRPEQQAMIRYWIGVPGEKPSATTARLTQKPVESPHTSTTPAAGSAPEKAPAPVKREVKVPAFLTDSAKEARGRERWIHALAVLALLSTATAAFGWWRWQQGWEELENHLRARPAAADTKTQVKVPPEVMQKFLVHKVQPVYPEEALQSRLRGTVLLETIIGEDGGVVSLKPVSGPDVLSRAAAESLRWWRFEPYKVDGHPVRVETTLSVEFQ